MNVGSLTSQGCKPGAIIKPDSFFMGAIKPVEAS